MDYKDYYKILGVDKQAGADEIKKAYRKLARKYHPDISKEKDAAARMAEVNEANTVLSDPEKRAAYDTLGEAPRQAGGAGGAGFQPPPGWEQGFHFREGDGAGGDADFSDFFSQMFGQAARARRAQGGHDGGARGAAHEMPDLRGQDQHADIELDVEDSYRGAQRTLHLRATAIDEHGQIMPRDKELQVSIPKGVREGQLIRLAGQGGPGLGGAPAGDLFLEVQFKPDARWRAEDRDVYQPLALAPWEAALGGPVQVQTPGGATVEVTIPAGWKPGRKLRLKERGIPAATPGDLYLELHVALPPATTEAQRAAYRALAQAFPHFQPRTQGA